MFHRLPNLTIRIDIRTAKKEKSGIPNSLQNRFHLNLNTRRELILQDKRRTLGGGVRQKLSAIEHCHNSLRVRNTVVASLTEIRSNHIRREQNVLSMTQITTCCSLCMYRQHCVFRDIFFIFSTDMIAVIRQIQKAL